MEGKSEIGPGNSTTLLKDLLLLQFQDRHLFLLFRLKGNATLTDKYSDPFTANVFPQRFALKTFNTDRAGFFSKHMAWFLFLGLILANPVWANSPSLVNLDVAAKGRYVTLDARLVNGLNGKVQEAIESGMPITFTYSIELREKGAMWGDRLVRASEVTHTVQYDSLKKVYRFSEEGNNVQRKVITHKKESYQKLMETLSQIPIAPIYRLDPDNTYYVRVRANLKADELRFPSNYLFFFVPFNDFKTSWAQSSPIAIDTVPTSVDEALNATPNEGEEEGNPEVLKHVIRSFNK